MGAKQAEAKITALYEWLSRDDEAAGDSNSIISQRRDWSRINSPKHTKGILRKLNLSQNAFFRDCIAHITLKEGFAF